MKKVLLRKIRIQVSGGRSTDAERNILFVVGQRAIRPVEDENENWLGNILVKKGPVGDVCLLGEPVENILSGVKK